MWKIKNFKLLAEPINLNTSVDDECMGRTEAKSAAIPTTGDVKVVQNGKYSGNNSLDSDDSDRIAPCGLQKTNSINLGPCESGFGTARRFAVL